MILKIKAKTTVVNPNTAASSIKGSTVKYEFTDSDNNKYYMQYSD